MSWRIEPQAQAPKVIIYVGEEIKKELQTTDPTEVKNAVINTMIDAGITAADVTINGIPTNPETFEDDFKRALEAGGDIIIRIVKVEKAG